MASAYCKAAKEMFPIVKSVMLQPGAMKGKRAFITGGGTGLGRQMAWTLASLDADVCIASRREDILQATADEIAKETGKTVKAIQLDVRKAENVKAAAEEALEHFGGLNPNIVINNAAGNFISATERLSPNAFKTVVDIVLNGTFNVTLEFGQRAIKAEQGCTFLAITTPYARTGSPFVVPSACAKSGVDTMVKSLAAEWGKYGMRFNAIAPGPIYTEGAFTRLDPSGEFAAQAHKKIPTGRLGAPEELANLAAYLVSDYSTWMNGSTIDFDGGETVLNSGEFSALHRVTNDQWDALENMIRASTGKAKK